MQFRLLGPVEIDVAGETHSLPRRRERCLLGVLLLNLNHVVPVELLIDLLWEQDPPERARRLIHSHVSRIRALLNGADGEAATGLTYLGGYRLTADPRSVDAHRFQSKVANARKISDPAVRVNELRAALDLWRGPAMSDSASTWQRGRLCAELDELRVIATEDVLAVSIDLGHERDILPELARVAAAHPGRENLVQLHMRALHRAGRKVDALDVYANARAYLIDELGLDPSPALTELHQAILRDELTSPLVHDRYSRRVRGQ